MKFDQWSDFHVEMNPAFNWKDHKPTSDILVLAGDTSNSMKNTIGVLEKACDCYKFVLFVPGNHDYYSDHNRDLVEEYLETNRPENSCMLNNSPFIYEDSVFVGNMGWYSWDYPGVGDLKRQAGAWYNYMNDSRYIYFPESEGVLPRDLAQRDAEDIRKRILEIKSATPNQKIVVVTHTVPNINAMVPRHHNWAHLNGSYFNSFMKDIWSNPETKPNVWTFGHTHFPYDFVEEDVRFVCNPRGYHGEATPGKRGPVTIEF